MTYFLGYDLGSSSVKVCLVRAEDGEIVASDHYPKQEMEIIATKAGWAEQHPKTWWENLKLAHKSVMRQSKVDSTQIAAIGISWQMHGLVAVDAEQNTLRPSIIWCDSRAVPYGERAFRAIGKERALSHLLNSPGNFTASKLAWVKENEPEVFEKIDKIMLPGDYIAMKLSGEISMTIEGLSEGVLWNFKNKKISKDVLDYFEIPQRMIPELKPIFGVQARVSEAVAQELGLRAGTPITYRAGDQPNNALSLNVFKPGEIASVAGTSGVVYGVTDKVNYDPLSRVNTFAHVNYTKEQERLGILLCINGTGILNSWLRRNVMDKNTSYPEMNQMGAQSEIGARGVTIIPFGNGAERVLENEEIGCSIHNINFNIHNRNDIVRAAQEGIVYSFQYGIEVMQQMGMEVNVIRAGYANMFLSPLFAQALANVSGATIELFNTDGAAGAAKGAGMGIGYYKNNDEAFSTLKRLKIVEPIASEVDRYRESYEGWKKILTNIREN